GISGDHANIEGIDPENLSDDVRENRVRTLTDVRRSAHHANSALAIQPQLHAGLRHVVPVDAQARTADVGRTRDADPFAVGKFARVSDRVRTQSGSDGIK